MLKYVFRVSGFAASSFRSCVRWVVRFSFASHIGPDHGMAQVRGLSMWLSFDIEGLSAPTRGHVGHANVKKELEQKKHLEATNRVKIQHLDLKLHKAKVGGITVLVSW